MNDSERPIRTLTDALHRLVRVQEDEGRLQKLMHEDEAQFRALDHEELAELLVTLQAYGQIMTQSAALQEVLKFRLQRLLVFTMQKVHVVHTGMRLKGLGEQCRWQAAEDLMMLFDSLEAADACCKDIFFLDWLTHVIADFPYDEEKPIFSKMLLRLSKSVHFPHQLKNRYIVRDMVYGQLARLMEKRHRTEAWRVNNPSRRENAFVSQYPALLEILLNRSNTYAGVLMLLDCKKTYELDIGWGILQFQLSQQTIRCEHLLQCLNLCHNLCLNPDYSPPLQASE